ncbi:hypothetical protein M8C21_010434 [Ambrosia artemisiifolia]|uniref:CCHC-type domain-containing protein n=1 Tax=Ambrosia artemisiifolia TaxID=4212 RepID=A0AAD5CYJ4_AMBAR|nr:hypothetical protein M8C21_010434 [Ambrosia artemisiifolia]
MYDQEFRRLGFRVCKNLTHEEVLELYVGALSLFSIKLHHNGRFTRFPDRTYVEGEENFIDLLDHDKFSVHEMDRILEKFGYQKDIERYYHYQVPGSDLDFGLRALGSDADGIGFIKVIPESSEHGSDDDDDASEDSDFLVDEGNLINEVETNMRDFRFFTIMPLFYHKAVGRPKKVRRKLVVELDEMTAYGKLRKVGTYGTCGKCGNKGHNSRSCNDRTPDESGSSKSKKDGKKAAKKDGKKAAAAGNDGKKAAAVGTTMQGQVKPKKGGVKMCKKCKGAGHNSRTCQKNA